jgi:steroid delta-isomerase-like uncharacterized protein
MYSTNVIQRHEWLIQQYFEEVWNNGNIDLLDALIAPGYVNHSSSVPGTPPGPEGLKPIVTAMRTAFPDLHYVIEDLVITADCIVARVTMSGTHTGDFFGIAPTNRKVSVSQINIEYLAAGKISQHWRLTDELSLMKQLGLIV